MSKSGFRLRAILSSTVIFVVVLFGLVAPTNAHAEPTSSPDLQLTQLREPPSNCGDSFQVTSAKRNGDIITVRIVGVDLARWLGPTGFGLVFVGFNDQEGGKNFQYNASGSGGANFQFDIVAGPDRRGNFFLSLTNDVNTYTHCSKTFNITA
jgi:hypothetical protein